MNEVQADVGSAGKESILKSQRIHELIELVKSCTRDGRLLLVSTSINPENWQPEGKWSEVVDFYLSVLQPGMWRRRKLAAWTLRLAFPRARNQL